MSKSPSLRLEQMGVGRPELQLALTFRSRTSFCPVRKALDDNDTRFVFGYAGSATAEIALETELDRLERNRAKAHGRGIDL